MGLVFFVVVVLKLEKVCVKTFLGGKIFMYIEMIKYGISRMVVT